MTEPLQVLILEDRPADAELMVQELKRAGFAPDWQRVATERDFQARLTPTLQVILADFTLPGFDALHALELLRASGLDVPCIIVSGSVGDDRAVAALKRGATDYILKDRMARLGPAVQRALRERADRHAARQARQALERSEAQMRSILSTVQDVVWSMSLPDGRLLYLNPAAEALTGRPAEEFLANPQKWLQTVHPDDYVKMANAQEEAIRWGTFESEYRMVRADGQVRVVALRAWTAYGPGGAPVRLEGIFTDVTDKRAMERERVELERSRREAERLAQLNEFKSRFLNMVAHDLNNVLTPMRIHLGMLDGRPERQDGAGGKAVAGLKASVGRLTAFLADLLDAARLQSGQLALNVQPFDLAARLREALEPWQAQAAAQGIRLLVDAPPELTLEADPHRVDQVVSNLVSNALKFTPVGGRVEVVASGAGETVLLSVRDTGHGIRPEDLPRLFQPFVKLGNVPQGKHTGTGLGLFLCRGIVEQHGGSLACESEGLGKGATFRVALPLRRPSGGPH